MAAAGNLPIKQPWLGTEVILHQNANITGAGADSDVGHDQEDSVNDDPDKEDVLLTLEAEGKLVVRQPLTVIAIEEQSFDVADIKLVKVIGGSNRIDVRRKDDATRTGEDEVGKESYILFSSNRARQEPERRSEIRQRLWVLY